MTRLPFGLHWFSNSNSFRSSWEIGWHRVNLYRFRAANYRVTEFRLVALKVRRRRFRMASGWRADWSMVRA